jgi:hypothetical protein
MQLDCRSAAKWRGPLGAEGEQQLRNGKGILGARTLLWHGVLPRLTKGVGSKKGSSNWEMVEGILGARTLLWHGVLPRSAEVLGNRLQQRSLLLLLELPPLLGQSALGHGRALWGGTTRNAHHHRKRKGKARRSDPGAQSRNEASTCVARRGRYVCR